ncbi:uncharacterized protein METZ01_LOCUS369067, partial [marine metagenome]
DGDKFDLRREDEDFRLHRFRLSDIDLVGLSKADKRRVWDELWKLDEIYNRSRYPDGNRYPDWAFDSQ